MGTRSVRAHTAKRYFNSKTVACTLFALVGTFGITSPSLAEAPKKRAPEAENSIFKRDFLKQGFFAEADVKAAAPRAEAPTVSVTSEPPKVVPGLDLLAIKQKLGGPAFVTNDPTMHILPPDQVPAVRINPEAPGPFVAMALANQQGDKALAKEYAKTLVKYQMNYFFEVRELTNLIGEALVDQGVVEEDNLPGVSQYIDYEMAKTRSETGDLFRPTHDRAMERIKGDARNEAEVYFFFTMNCSYCRRMAPDVERLWQTVQRDKKVKMVGLMLGKVPKDWVDEYRAYTGITLPIFEGAKQAKAFRVGFVPALVVVSPLSSVNGTSP